MCCAFYFFDECGDWPKWDCDASLAKMLNKSTDPVSHNSYTNTTEALVPLHVIWSHRRALDVSCRLEQWRSRFFCCYSFEARRFLELKFRRWSVNTICDLLTRMLLRWPAIGQFFGNKLASFGSFVYFPLTSHFIPYALLSTRAKYVLCVCVLFLFIRFVCITFSVPIELLNENAQSDGVPFVTVQTNWPKNGNFFSPDFEGTVSQTATRMHRHSERKTNVKNVRSSGRANSCKNLFHSFYLAKMPDYTLLSLSCAFLLLLIPLWPFSILFGFPWCFHACFCSGTLAAIGKRWNKTEMKATRQR